jgi:DNA-binding NtrC family response regulator
MNTGPLLHVGDLPSSLQNFLISRKSQSMALAAVAGFGTATIPMPVAMPPGREDMPILSLTEIERRAIAHALEYTRGDRGVAANLLGIGRTTLYRKIKEYQLAC